MYNVFLKFTVTWWSNWMRFYYSLPSSFDMKYTSFGRVCEKIDLSPTQIMTFHKETSHFLEMQRGYLICRLTCKQKMLCFPQYKDLEIRKRKNPETPKIKSETSKKNPKNLMCLLETHTRSHKRVQSNNNWHVCETLCSFFNFLSMRWCLFLHLVENVTIFRLVAFASM